MKTHNKIVLFVVAVVFCLMLVPAFAQQATGKPAPPPDVTSVITVFLVLSVVFEVALTPIFNWRIFLTYFEGKGLKTPITVIAAMLVFWKYDLDIIRDLLVVLNKPDPGITLGGQFITALLISGGSDGIFRIFTVLKIRNPEERDQKAKEAQKALAARKKQGKR